MQTLLVHLRQPAALFQQTGVLPALAFLLVLGGGLLSSLAHPLMIFLVFSGVSYAYSGFQGDPMHLILLLIDSSNLFASYILFALLGLPGLTPGKGQKHRLLRIPQYWFMLTLAGWMALVELYRKPHFWEKTAHIPHRARENVTS